MLTGDGGDEMFGGYSHHQWRRWAALYRRLPRVADSYLLAAAGTLSRRVDGRSGASDGSRGLSATHGDRLRHAALVGEVPFPKKKLTLYSGDPRARSLGTTTALLERRMASAEPTRPRPRSRNWLDVSVWLPDEMLAKVDRMTMAASIEARCPLLDRDLRGSGGSPLSTKGTRSARA